MDELHEYTVTWVGDDGLVIEYESKTLWIRGAAADKVAHWKEVDASWMQRAWLLGLALRSLRKPTPAQVERLISHIGELAVSEVAYWVGLSGRYAHAMRVLRALFLVQAHDFAP